MTTTYCTLFRIGFWCSLAMCETSEPAEFPGLTDHTVHYRLIDKFGEALGFGSQINHGPGEIGWLEAPKCDGAR
jgi:hypothetical protein